MERPSGQPTGHSAGAFVLDINTGAGIQAYTGGGRQLEVLTAMPEPAIVLPWVGGLLAVAGSASRRRRLEPSQHGQRTPGQGAPSRQSGPA